MLNNNIVDIIADFSVCYDAEKFTYKNLINVNNLCGIKWLYRNRARDEINKAIVMAALMGRFSILRWFQSRNISNFTDTVMIAAARAGQLGIIKWLNSTEIYGTNVMDTAAEWGHIDTVKWLHENSTVGCTRAAMDLASKNGHLDVVIFLHENRREGCTAWAVRGAVGSGNIDIVKLLYTYYPAKVSKSALKAAAKQCRSEILEWIYASRPERCTPADLICAVKLGLVNIVRFLLDQHPDFLCESILIEALQPRKTSKLKHINIVECMYNARPDVFTYNALRQTHRRGMHQVMEFVRSNFILERVTQLIDSAFADNRGDIISHLYAYRAAHDPINMHIWRMEEQFNTRFTNMPGGFMLLTAATGGPGQFPLGPPPASNNVVGYIS